MTAPTPAALDALAAKLRAKRHYPTQSEQVDDALFVEAAGAISALRAQIETLTTELYETRRLHGKHILDASSQISALEARALASDTARASAEAALAEARIDRQLLLDAIDELLEVAGLRGDNNLPHPADDPKMWTARMQDAWDEVERAREDVTARAAMENTDAK